jgi:hypothetical protein
MKWVLKWLLRKIELELDDSFYEIIMIYLPFLGYESFEDFITDAVVLRYEVLLPLLAP